MLLLDDWLKTKYLLTLKIKISISSKKETMSIQEFFLYFGLSRFLIIGDAYSYYSFEVVDSIWHKPNQQQPTRLATTSCTRAAVLADVLRYSQFSFGRGEAST